jgi:signal transduction histidine kinase
MNEQSKPSQRHDRLLDAAAYLTMAAVFSLLAITRGTRPSERSAALAVLCAAFVLIQVRGLRVSGERPAWLRLAPFAVSGLLVAAMLFLAMNGTGYIPVLMAILVAEAFFILSERQALALTVAYSLLIAISVVLISTATDALLTTMIYGGAFVFFGTVTNASRRAQAAREQSERLLQELDAAHRELRQHAERVEELAVAEERTRIAREIHDSLGHHLTLPSVELQAASKLITLDPPRAAGEIEKARAVVADALRAVRQSVSALRATSLDELRPAEALPRLIQDFREATGVLVNYQGGDPDALKDLSPAQAITLYRAAQEGLTNVQKHAHASRVDIALVRHDDTLRLSIGDNGVGQTDAASAGFGLLGLRERVELLGGRLAAGARDGAGYELSIELPLGTKERA